MPCLPISAPSWKRATQPSNRHIIRRKRARARPLLFQKITAFNDGDGMESILSTIERIAGFALAVVAGLIVVSALLRYGFAMNLPDGFDLARYLQGIAIMWGLSVATYYNSHIGVDIVWEVSGPRARRAIDLFAGLVTAGFFLLFSWALLSSLPSLAGSHEVTVDLRIPTWYFYGVAVAGVCATAFVSLVVLLRAFKSGDQQTDG